MKLLATLALFGVISANDVDSVLDEDAQLWVQVSAAHMRVVCPKLHPSLNDAIKNADLIPISQPHEKAITELVNAQQTLGQRCSWNGTFYTCQYQDEQYILSQLMAARQKLGTLSRKNTSNYVKEAYNHAYWGHEYAQRCINAQSVLALQVAQAQSPELDISEDELAMIKLGFTDNGASIKKEAEEVQRLAQDIDKKGLNKDLKAGIEALMKSKEAADLKAYNDKFQKSPMGQKVHAAVGKALTNTGDSIKRHPHELELPNEKIPALKKDWEAAEATMKAAKKEGAFDPFKQGFEALGKSKEAAQLKHAADEFEKTPAAKQLKKELLDLKHAVKSTARWSDLPKDVKIPDAPMDDTSFLY